MLRSLKSISGYRLNASDGNIGHAHDFYFDDSSWIVRYLVAETGNWLIGKKVLLSPVSLEEPQWNEKIFPVLLSKQQIENSPDVSKDMPISKQKEHELATYYDWPIYWPVGHTAVPPHVSDLEHGKTKSETETKGDPHLRSFQEVTGYGCEASDGDFGHIDDFIVEDKSWTIRYLVISTRSILPGKKVLISPMWADDIKWQDRKVRVSLTKNAIKNSPEFNPSEPINRAYEEELYDYYGRPVYWKQEYDKAATHF